MNIDKKNLFLYLTVLIFIVPVFLYLKGIKPQTFSGMPGGGILGSGYFGAIIAFGCIATFHSKFKFLRRPLWGFQQTSGGYKDTSLTKHPYAIAILALVIISSFTYMIFMNGNF